MTQLFRIAAAGLSCSCAAPAGGAPSGGWGRTLASLLCLVSPQVLAAEPLDVPSGRDVTPIEYITDADGQGYVLRARYLAPELTGDDDIDSIFADMAHLCETDALPLRSVIDPVPPRIIVSLSGARLAFGEINADVVQYFEAYRVENDRCIWELF